MNSCFTLALVSGLSVADISRYAVNLGWDQARMPAPGFEGDTIYARTEVLSVRASESRPKLGIVEVQTTGFKQDGTVVMEYRRTIMVYKRGCQPLQPQPVPHDAG